MTLTLAQCWTGWALRLCPVCSFGGRARSCGSTGASTSWSRTWGRVCCTLVTGESYSCQAPPPSHRIWHELHHNTERGAQCSQGATSIEPFPTYNCICSHVVKPSRSAMPGQGPRTRLTKLETLQHRIVHHHTRGMLGLEFGYVEVSGLGIRHAVSQCGPTVWTHWVPD